MHWPLRQGCHLLDLDTKPSFVGWKEWQLLRDGERESLRPRTWLEVMLVGGKHRAAAGERDGGRGL